MRTRPPSVALAPLGDTAVRFCPITFCGSGCSRFRSALSSPGATVLQNSSGQGNRSTSSQRWGPQLISPLLNQATWWRVRCGSPFRAVVIEGKSPPSGSGSLNAGRGLSEPPFGLPVCEEGGPKASMKTDCSSMSSILMVPSNQSAIIRIFASLRRDVFCGLPKTDGADSSSAGGADRTEESGRQLVATSIRRPTSNQLEAD